MWLVTAPQWSAEIITPDNTIFKWNSHSFDYFEMWRVDKIKTTLIINVTLLIKIYHRKRIFVPFCIYTLTEYHPWEPFHRYSVTTSYRLSCAFYCSWYFNNASMFRLRMHLAWSLCCSFMGSYHLQCKVCLFVSVKRFFSLLFTFSVRFLKFVVVTENNVDCLSRNFSSFIVSERVNLRNKLTSAVTLFIISFHWF